ncbi:MAG TPA: two-component regulator propeller domain-containing protein, partial [Acidobacteriota bacterium]|nr:two-component regulator propeller domain-containing protein [Acidobacteriota bacterium]
GNSRGLTSNRFSSLFEDTDGTLWIGTIDGGLTRLRDGVFTTFTTADGLPHNWIHNIQRQSNGELLITTENGFAYWREGQFIADPERLNSSTMVFFTGPTGTDWRWDAEGLHRLTGHRITFPIKFKNYGVKHLHPFEDQQGNLWVGTFNDGVYVITGDRFRHFTSQDGLPARKLILPQCQDRAGDIWFSSEDLTGNGLSALLHFKNGRFSSYPTSMIIRTIFEDREGTLWIGTNGQGLNRLTYQFITTYSTANGLVGNNVYPIYQDRAGSIWIGAFGGLSRYKDGSFTNYTVREGLLSPNVQAFCEDNAGRLWMGGRPSFFQNGRFYMPPDGIPFMDYMCFAIYQDRSGVLWFGTHRGLVKYEHGKTFFLTVEDGLPGSDVLAIHQDRQGVLWFATGGGIARLENGKFTVFTVADGLTTNYMRCIYEDAEGVLWFGTYDGGLIRYQTGRFTCYTTREGLHNNGVFQILEDNRGNFWMSCNQGIYRVSRRQLNDFAAGKIQAITSIAYNKHDGMLNIECNGGRQPAGIKARDGKLWFPTQEGVAIVDPEAVPTNSLAPSVLIETCRLDREVAAFQGGLRISPGQSNLEIQYTGLSFIKPEQMRFKYQLIGQDPDWVDAGTRRMANYSYLPPGEYTFKVIAANSDGVWNLSGVELQIVVLPRFYQTWWFRGLIVLMLAGITGLVFKVRLNQVERARRVQEAFSRRLIDSQEQERQRIAAELHDSLGQNLLVIKNYALMGLTTAEDDNPMREHLVEISDAATLSIEEVRQIAHNLRPYQLERLGLTRTLQSMLQQIANASDIGFTWEIDQIDGLLSKEGEIGLYRIVQEALNNILKHSKASDASVSIQLDGDELHVTITDNGCGFTVEASGTAELQKRGFGLTGSAERVRMLGGKQTIRSAPGQGTTIFITITTNRHVN